MAQWTITNASGGPSGEKLKGCHLKKTSTRYELTAPDNSFLAATNGFMFPFHLSFPYDGWTWTVSVETISSGASGHWENTKPNTKDEEGSWSAGAGTDPESKATQES